MVGEQVRTQRRMSTFTVTLRSNSEDGRSAGGVYLWETRAAAEAIYNSEWKARVKQLYGSEPKISWFDTPVVVDNQAGAITKAA